MKSKLIVLLMFGLMAGCTSVNSSNDSNSIVSEPYITAKIDHPEPVSKKIPKPVNFDFKVEKGTLKDNAEKLSNMYGYKVYSWTAKNFMIEIPYTFKYKSIEEAFSILFMDYPVQAQLIDTGISEERAVNFVSRRVVTDGVSK